MADIRRELQPQHHRSGIHVSDILFALFRCKWTIVFCTLLGLAGAAAMFYLFPPAYQSQAKLLVRYVLERNGVDPIDNTTRPNEGGRMSKTDSVIDAEVQILTSWDLAAQVAEAIGPKRLGASSNAAAAGSIIGGLQVVAYQGKRRHCRILHERRPAARATCFAGAVEPLFCQAPRSAPIRWRLRFCNPTNRSGPSALEPNRGRAKHVKK